MVDWRADSLVDELVPEEVDWRSWVGRYPWATLSLAALGGFLLARSHGDEIVDAVSANAADAVSESLHRVIEARS